MKKASRIFLLLFALLFAQLRAFSQDDSLLFYFNHPSASDPVTAYSRLFRTFREADSLRIRGLVARIGTAEQRALFYQAAGKRFYRSDDYDNARYYYRLSLEAANSSGNKKLIADAYMLIGDMYRLQDRNTIALKYLFHAAGISREIGDQRALGHELSLIGDIDRCEQQYTDALRYGQAALALALKTGSTADETFCYSSLGTVYEEMDEYGKAYATFRKGLDIAVSTKDTARIIDFDFSIADMLIDEDQATEAMPYLDKGIALSKRINDQYHLAFCYIGVARAQRSIGRNKESIEAGLKAFALGESLHAGGFSVDAAAVLHSAYAALGDYKSAYRYLKIDKDDDDSTHNSSNIKYQAQLELGFRESFRQKQDSLVRAAQQSQKDLIQHEELVRQKTYAIAGIIGLLMALAIVVIVFRFYRKERRTRQIINKQKLIVDEKNKEIVDSINYAKRIQQAIIPRDAEVKRIFPESFVLLLPRDIVSGDFYWVSERGRFVFFAVADCTGHGVPGGFMSMLGTALLNEIINDKLMQEPAEILDLLRMKIIAALRQSDNTNENKDGMDIALLRIDRHTHEAVFAGANNPLYIVRKGALNELKGDKYPIGFSFNVENEQFTQQHVQLEKGDVIYLFSDGYADQFGGPHGKKFKRRQLEALLLRIYSLSAEAQQQQLIETHVSWKGELEQVDDICIAGLRI